MERIFQKNCKFGDNISQKLSKIGISQNQPFWKLSKIFFSKNCHKLYQLIIFIIKIEIQNVWFFPCHPTGDDNGKIWVYDVGEQLANPAPDEWNKFAHTLQDIKNNKAEEDLDKFAAGTSVNLTGQVTGTSGPGSLPSLSSLSSSPLRWFLDVLLIYICAIKNKTKKYNKVIFTLTYHINTLYQYENCFINIVAFPLLQISTHI